MRGGHPIDHHGEYGRHQNADWEISHFFTYTPRSKTGLDEELVAQLKSKTAFLPVGENGYGHPDLEVLDMLRNVGTQTYCSEKTKNCRKECKEGGYGNLCHKNDKDSRPGWSNVNAEDCKNNINKA